MVTVDTIKQIMQVYKEAWEKQDPELIVTIFTKDATYTERAFSNKYEGHAGIKKYWQEKVIGQQKDVSFDLKKVYVDGEVAIVEWATEFFDFIKECKTKLMSVAILEIRENKIFKWREYWHSKHEDN
jgi:uncharacterized protein (TIGR02246 family)